MGTTQGKIKDFSIQPYTKEERFRNSLLRVEMYSIEHYVRHAVDRIIAKGKIPKITVTSNNVPQISSVENLYLTRSTDTEIYIKIS